MDINTIRGLTTLVALIAFLSVAFWAYSSRRKSDFEEAASLPFVDEPEALVLKIGVPDTEATNSHRATHDASCSKNSHKKASQKRGVA